MHHYVTVHIRRAHFHAMARIAWRAKAWFSVATVWVAQWQPVLHRKRSRWSRLCQCHLARNWPEVGLKCQQFMRDICCKDADYGKWWKIMKMNGDGPEMMWTIKVVWINIGIKVLIVADDCLSLDRGEPWCFLNPLRVQQRKVCLAALLGCRQHLGLGGNGWYCILLYLADKFWWYQWCCTQARPQSFGSLEARFWCIGCFVYLWAYSILYTFVTYADVCVLKFCDIQNSWMFLSPAILTEMVILHDGQHVCVIRWIFFGARTPLHGPFHLGCWRILNQLEKTFLHVWCITKRHALWEIRHGTGKSSI